MVASNIWNYWQFKQYWHKMNLYTQKLVKKFIEKRPLYEDFCLAMDKLFRDLLSEKKYKCQLFYRVKSVDRLKEKIIRKTKEKKLYKNLSDINDLVGIRIVFYLESDKEKFANDLQKELPNIVSIEKFEKINGYHAQHIVIKMDRKRLQLSEYKKFKDLRCEVQLLSIFNHVWAELEHDWLYKNMYGLKTKNPSRYEIIKKQMDDIFKKYVNKLTSKFESIAKQIRN
jgi:ppGpp synthetase/RelA/SpoT-type nucleotidyltranferase